MGMPSAVHCSAHVGAGISGPRPRGEVWIILLDLHPRRPGLWGMKFCFPNGPGLHYFLVFVTKHPTESIGEQLTVKASIYIKVIIRKERLGWEVGPGYCPQAQYPWSYTYQPVFKSRRFYSVPQVALPGEDQMFKHKGTLHLETL